MFAASCRWSPQIFELLRRIEIAGQLALDVLRGLLAPEEAGVLAVEADPTSFVPHLAVDLHHQILAVEPSPIVVGPGHLDPVTVVEVLAEDAEAGARVFERQPVLVIDLHRSPI